MVARIVRHNKVVATCPLPITSHPLYIAKDPDGYYACASFPPTLDQEGVSVLQYGVDTELGFVKQRGSSEVFCAARPSDVADTEGGGLTLGFSTAGQSETVGEQMSQGVAVLGGRSPEVLLARELLYRACELSANLNADSDTSIEIYRMFLQAVTELGGQNQGSGSQGFSAMTDTKAPSDIKAPALPPQQRSPEGAEQRDDWDVVNGSEEYDDPDYEDSDYDDSDYDDSDYDDSATAEDEDESFDDDY